MDQRETALARRHVRRGAELERHTKEQTKLSIGDTVLVQNQCVNKPLRWDRTGTIVQVKEHDQYEVKMDGSGRLSLRNRRFLRPTTPYTRRENNWNRDLHTPASTQSPPVQEVHTPSSDVSSPAATPVDTQSPPVLTVPTPVSTNVPQSSPAPPPGPQSRRSGRERRIPARLNDYQLKSIVARKIYKPASNTYTKAQNRIGATKAPIRWPHERVPSAHPGGIDSGSSRPAFVPDNGDRASQPIHTHTLSLGVTNQTVSTQQHPGLDLLLCLR